MRRRRWLMTLVLLPVGIWVASAAAVLRAARTDAAAPADAIIVLGAAQYDGKPSPVLRARLDHAANLWERGLAPVIIVTGGVGTRDTLSEAAVAAAWLRRARSLPDSAIVMEATGRSSEPSLRAAARDVRQRGGTRVILVSDGFHLLRLAIVARRLGLEPRGSPAAASPIRGNWRREFGYIMAESFKAPVAFLVTRSE